jgi:hypothetical protein
MKLRKIETPGEKEKSDRMKSIIIGIALLAIMVLSTAGYAIRQEKSNDSMKYKNFNFIRIANGWQIQSPFSLSTRFNPREVESIICNTKLSKDSISGQDVYFVAFNSDEIATAREILSNIPVSRAQQACIEENSNSSLCADLPVKNCEENIIFIIKEIKNENETVIPKAYQQNRCIFIESNYNNLTMTADRVLFSIYGVI